MANQTIAPLKDDLAQVAAEYKDALVKERAQPGADKPATKGLLRAMIKWCSNLSFTLHLRHAKHIDALTERVAALEAEPRTRYCGIWRAGTIAQPGDLVTHTGSLWHCWRATSEMPGTTNDWQLMVKNAR